MIFIQISFEFMLSCKIIQFIISKGFAKKGAFHFIENERKFECNLNAI